MQQLAGQDRGWRDIRRRWTSPFTAPVPADVRTPLVRLQYDRLLAMLPVICLVVAANAIAMMVAVLGDLPYWQQFTPPALIVGTCVAGLIVRKRWQAETEIDVIYRRLRNILFIMLALGPIAGMWSVNAFTETEKYYCMVAPVFIGIAALVTASCMVSVPRAAVAGMAGAVVPIVIKMTLYPNLGVRAMAAMLVLVTLMQSVMVLGRFKETVRMLTAQNKLNQLAQSDPLTGLANRRAFLDVLEAELARGTPVMVALTDLNGFKAANDAHGHLAGDTVLAGVAQRMTTVAVSALSVARLGGDEFALLFDVSGDPAQADLEIQAVRAMIALPFAHEGAIISITTSIGTATSPTDADGTLGLLRVADQRLYADKRGEPALIGRRTVKGSPPNQAKLRPSRSGCANAPGSGDG